MDTFVRKQLSVALMGLLYLALGLPLHGYQAEVRPCDIPLKHTKEKGQQAQVIRVSLDRYLQGEDFDVEISAREQQSILWTCTKCTFMIRSIVPDPRVKDLPPRVRRHLERFRRGPFHRQFPEDVDEPVKDEFFYEVDSGPLLLDAAPRQDRPEAVMPSATPGGTAASQTRVLRPSSAPHRVETYSFKVTFWIKRAGRVCEFDPHIVTTKGVGPDH
jgi:hypothetical protein